MAISLPHFVTPEELPGVLALYELCFSSVLPEGAVARWPQLFTTEGVFEQNIVCSDGGRVVSNVGFWPAMLSIDGASLSVAGLTSVATHPDYRGRGLMQQALKMALSVMWGRGIACCWLTGDRVRYGHFGWENAGRKYYFSITPRTLRRAGRDDVEIRRFEGEAELVRVIRGWYEARSLHMQRDEVLTSMLLQRARTETYMAMHHGQPISYINLEPCTWSPTQIFTLEHGGDAEGVLDLLHYTFTTSGYQQLILFSPMGNDPCRRMLFENAALWSLESSYLAFPTSTMLKIIDFPTLLKAFTRQMALKREQTGCIPGGEVTLRIAETGQQATIRVGSTVEVSDKPCREVITLPEREMVRFLFGIASALDVADCPEWLVHLLPLDFFISPMEDV